MPAWHAPCLHAGERLGARLLIANDPDVDRLAVAERCASHPSGWTSFKGNEIGVMLAHWVWTNFREQHPEVGGGGGQGVLWVRGGEVMGGGQGVL